MYIATQGKGIEKRERTMIHMKQTTVQKNIDNFVMVSIVIALSLLLPYQDHHYNRLHWTNYRYVRLLINHPFHCPLSSKVHKFQIQIGLNVQSSITSAIWGLLWFHLNITLDTTIHLLKSVNKLTLMTPHIKMLGDLPS